MWAYLQGNDSEMNRLYTIIAERVLESFRSPDAFYISLALASTETIPICYPTQLQLLRTAGGHYMLA